MSSAPTSDLGLPVLLVVEGLHDLNFLQAISAMLHRHDPTVPDLAELEAQRQLVALPVGGSHLTTFSTRLAGLGKREFHLYDREVEPATSTRQKVVAAINQRPGCVAVLTQKRALENYLHTTAIAEACSMVVTFDDASDLSGLLAQRVWAATGTSAWDELDRRARSGLRHRVKRMLTTAAVRRMTPELLAERDPQGEVSAWLRTLQRLLDGAA